MNPLLVTVDEAARMTGIGRTRLYQELRRGRLRSVSIGRARRIAVSDLSAYVARLQAEAEATDAVAR